MGFVTLRMVEVIRDDRFNARAVNILRTLFAEVAVRTTRKRYTTVGPWSFCERRLDRDGVNGCCSIGKYSIVFSSLILWRAMESWRNEGLYIKFNGSR